MTDDTRSLVAWLAEAKRDGRITTYAIELRDDDRQVVVTVVPKAYAEFVDVELLVAVEADQEQPTRVLVGFDPGETQPPAAAEEYEAEEIDAGVALVTPKKPEST